MATARIERNTNRHILNLVDAIDVRATDCGTWGFHHDCPTTSTFGAMTMQPTTPYGYSSAHVSAYGLLHHPLPTGHAGPWLGDKAKAERRAILPRDPVV
jgi:hypothetical protein